MHYEQLEKVPVKLKSYTVDFLKNGDYCINAMPDKESIKPAFAYTDTGYRFSDANYPVKFYCVDGKIFYRSSAGKIFKRGADAFEQFCSVRFTTEPNIVPVIYQGRKQYLIFSSNKAVVCDLTETVVSVPYSKVYEVYNGMLFVAIDNVVRFSAPFDFTDFTMDLNLGGYMEVDGKLGNVKGLVNCEDYLLMVCEHGLAKFVCEGERVSYDYKVLTTPYLDVRDGSVKKAGDGVYFISENRLYEYKNGKLTVVDDICKNRAITFTDRAVECNGNYIIPVTIADRYGVFVYVYRNKDGKSFFADGVAALSDSGGLFLDRVTGKLSKFDSDNSSLKNAEYRSLPLDMGSDEEKRVTKIEVKTKGTCAAVLYGDFGEYACNFNDGYNFIRTNLVSKNFTIKISTHLSSMLIEHMKLIYT